MKLTKKQREQVVELLRCAADASMDILDTPLDVSDEIRRLACSARWSVTDERHGTPADPLDVPRSHDDRDRLEAAQRVEEGSWP